MLHPWRRRLYSFILMNETPKQGKLPGTIRKRSECLCSTAGHRQALNAQAGGRWGMERLTQLCRFSLWALMQITPFALVCVGLSPSEFWFPTNSITQSKASQSQCVLPGFRLKSLHFAQCSSVTINWPRCTQILAYICLEKKKSYNFFITVDPSVWDCYRSPQTRS